MPDVTNAELVEQVAQGDHEAFCRLVDQYKGSVAALIRRLVADPHEREDLLQETLVLAWRNIASLRNPDRAHAWILQIARSRCFEWHKSRARSQNPADQQQMEAYMNRYGRVSTNNRRDAIVEAVRSLPTTERQAIELFYIQGLTIREICAATRSPEGTVKSRLFNARHHLRSILDEREET